MCGRFTLRAKPEEIADHFELETAPAWQPRYNVAPGQPVAVVCANRSGARSFESRHWGLVPGWAKDPAIGNRMINARAETLAEKPAFKRAFARRRCLIPADGFYEWAAGSTPKQPYWIAREDGGLFAFAGLWESWHAEEEDALLSCAIVTTDANAALAPIHHRMPVILDPKDYHAWLRTDDAEPDSALLAPCPDDWLRAQPVGLRVNDTRNDDPGCIESAPPQPVQESLL